MIWGEDEEGRDRGWGIPLLVAVLVVLVAGAGWFGYWAGVEAGTQRALASFRCAPPTTCPEASPCPPAPEPPNCAVSNARSYRLGLGKGFRDGEEVGMRKGREAWRCKNVWKVPESCSSLRAPGAFQCSTEQP